MLLLILLAAAQEVAPDTRPFRLGFTGFPHDHTPEAFLETKAFVQAHGDLIAHHIEGVPWAEMHAGGGLPERILEDWRGKASMTPPRGKVYLAVSPGRGELKTADKAAPLPAALRGKPYDDPAVKAAYLRYCRLSIDVFKPDWLAIGIETNEIHNGGPTAWKAYVALHRHVYEALKKEHPGLPVFASFTLHNMFKARGAMLAAWKDLMPHNDLVAVSYYPFFVGGPDALGALDWLLKEFPSSGKPIAMVETNEAAERLPLPQAGVTIEGSPEKQTAYYAKLLRLAHGHRFAFVVSFVHRDYDALWEKIKGSAPELFLAWRDCGFLDEKGAERPAFAVWKRWFAARLDAR